MSNLSKQRWTEIESLLRAALDQPAHLRREFLANACAGDRGLLHEELTSSATKEEASEVIAQKFDLYLCANRTCEVGMEHATQAPYESFVFALEELTRP